MYSSGHSFLIQDAVVKKPKVSSYWTKTRYTEGRQQLGNVCRMIQYSECQDENTGDEQKDSDH